MSYECSWTGELRFSNELTGSQLAELDKFLGDDFRDHPEWLVWVREEDADKAKFMTYIDLEVTKDYSGLKWNDSEKTHSLAEALNMIIGYMYDFTEGEFALEGELYGSGRGLDERYKISIDKEGWAVEEQLAVEGTVVSCPHCEEQFVLGED